MLAVSEGHFSCSSIKSFIVIALKDNIGEHIYLELGGVQTFSTHCAIVFVLTKG